MFGDSLLCIKCKRKAALSVLYDSVKRRGHSIFSPKINCDVSLVRSFKNLEMSVEVSSEEGIVES